MAGDFDEKVGMDVIKDSMGLTDEDLAPQSTGDDDLPSDDGDFGDDLPDSDPHESNMNGRDYDPEIERQPQQRPQQRPPQQQPQDPLRARSLQFDPRADFRRDAKGNLVDPRSGEIIARAGSEARIYQRIHKQATDYIRGASGRIQGALAEERGKLNRAVEIGLVSDCQLVRPAKAELRRAGATAKLNFPQHLPGGKGPDANDAFLPARNRSGSVAAIGTEDHVENRLAVCSDDTNFLPSNSVP